MNPNLTDLRGVQINVGDTIAYPGRQGSSVYMNVGIVRAINEDWQSGHSLKVERTLDSSGYRKTGGIVTIREYDRTVVVSSEVAAIGPAPVEMR